MFIEKLIFGSVSKGTLQASYNGKIIVMLARKIPIGLEETGLSSDFYLFFKR